MRFESTELTISGVRYNFDNEVETLISLYERVVGNER